MINEFIIKVSNVKIFLDPQTFVPIENTNIPIKHLTFRSHTDIFWKVEVVEYRPIEKYLKVKVNDYTILDRAEFETQIPTREITHILFEKIDWKKLEPTLTSYQKNKLLEILSNINTNPFSIGDLATTKVSGNNWPSTISLTSASKGPMLSKHSEDFKIDITDVVFIQGGVTFKRCIKYLLHEFEFNIQNDHILPAFENVKFWFAKKFKSKKIDVNAVFSLANYDVMGISTTSKQIDQINPALIDSIKHERTLRLTKKPKSIDPYKSIFIADEIFTQVDTNDNEGNIFHQSDNEILSILVEKGDVRNKKQLEYLADEKQTTNQKLRYTLHPIFGFLFLIEGKTYNHFVWELLNSHATYIWSIETKSKHIDSQFNIVETEVNIIRSSGRENYKLLNKNKHQDNLFTFHVITHDDITSNLADNFEKWMSKLNGLVV